ncbi:MAG: hypothetical protein COC06_07640 [Bacteroidales bacterium]|nr:MAG: hypothetical protein COC06_07640 [Bacteroidales bacterium]
MRIVTKHFHRSFFFGAKLKRKTCLNGINQLKDNNKARTNVRALLFFANISFCKMEYITFGIIIKIQLYLL